MNPLTPQQRVDALTAGLRALSKLEAEHRGAIDRLERDFGTLRLPTYARLIAEHLQAAENARRDSEALLQLVKQAENAVMAQRVAA